MWAVIDTDGKTVVSSIPPDANIEQIETELNGRSLIKMTIENSPAAIGWEWDGQKFHPKNEE